MASYDAAVIGSGMIGSAIAYGLTRRGFATVMIDEGGVSLRVGRCYEAEGRGFKLLQWH